MIPVDYYVLLSAVLFVMGLVAGGAQLPLAGWVSAKLTIPLAALGVVILIATRLVPLNWVFVCPDGVIRTRGEAWDGIRWVEVERFEDATLGQKGVTLRQCRLVLSDGREWGFLADYVADYPRLAEALSRKVSEHVATRPEKTAAERGAPADGVGT